MKRKRLLWYIFPSYLLIILVSLAAVTWYASNSLRKFHLNETKTDLEIRAILADSILGAENYSTNQPDTKLNQQCKLLGQTIRSRITVIMPSGVVIADSEENPQVMDNHANRPEVIKALKGEIGNESRFSQTLGANMKYVAVPIIKDGAVKAIIRTSISLASIDKELKAIYIKIATGGLIIVCVAGALCLGVSRRISQPLEELKHGAERFASGDFTHKLSSGESHEIGALAEAMNQMAEELDEKINTITQQRNEKQAVLASMIEGVIAVDMEEQILSMNSAAAALLETDIESATGQHLQEVSRNSELHKFVEQSLANDEAIEGQIILHNMGEQRYLHSHGTSLRVGSSNESTKLGSLIVLNDITQLRRLEKMRTDFVANVSHELRTPITSIKGFVETLLDGALKDPEDAQRFLEIIGRQAARLDAIIEDLLVLSKLEKQTETAGISILKHKVIEVLNDAVGLCELKAKQKHINFAIDCDTELVGEMNGSLLEQAIVNLIDNAIKFSEEGGTIDLKVETIENELLINVRDYGCGIRKKYLPRLFERFYRVDKGRSRAMGGTGLGLAIVKHIVQAHNGYVTVESEVNKGTKFIIHLPARG